MIAETLHADSVSAQRQVTYFGGQTYKWQSSTSANAPDGVVDLSWNMSSVSTTREAMWIFQDLRTAWDYIRNTTSPQIDPGSVTARWEQNSDSLGLCAGSCFFAIGDPYIFIADNSAISVDTIVHEASHHYMYNATGWWLYWDISCYYHNIFSQEDGYCAWSEGWADFLPVARTAGSGDQCYDFGAGPCTGISGTDHYNLEIQGWGDGNPTGEGVEGRVAGALLDIFDTANDPSNDSATFGFDTITDIVLQGSGETTLNEFWNAWRASGLNQHQAVRAIYQNTIDYDNAPRFDLPLEDQIVLKNIPDVHAIDLWAYSADDESSDAELTYQITSVTDTRCGIGVIDAHWISINPQSGWLGFCDATVQVNDSLKTSSDSFRVTVVPVAGRIYLPIVGK